MKKINSFKDLKKQITKHVQDAVDDTLKTKVFEEGVTIAKIILTKSKDICVVYFDTLARTDVYAQVVIQEAKGRLIAREEGKIASNSDL